MRKGLCLFLLVCIITAKGMSQELIWHAGMDSFFDNTEFSGSEYKISQTMAGIVIAPEAGLRWDTVHSIIAGLSLLHEFGSNETVDRVYPTAYYEFSRNPVRFIMGSFPRAIALEKYPRVFFQDSVNYYRPNINGIFFEVVKRQDYLNVWLDWTGRKSVDVREAFFAGLSGNLSRGLFFARGFGYMYHFAGKMDPVVDEALHDNLLLQASAGLDFSGLTPFDRLEAGVGWVMGLERARADNTGWVSMPGIVIEARAEYKFAGVSSLLYRGRGLMYFYNDHGNELYWGDPVYRAKTYNRTDLYLSFLRERTVNLELTYSIHFMESSLYHEQLLKVRVNLGSK